MDVRATRRPSAPLVVEFRCSPIVIRSVAVETSVTYRLAFPAFAVFCRRSLTSDGLATLASNATCGMGGLR